MEGRKGTRGGGEATGGVGDAREPVSSNFVKKKAVSCKAGPTGSGAPSSVYPGV